MRKTFAILTCAAMALLLFWPEAHAVTDVQWGQSTRGVQQLRLVGGVLLADSSGALFTFESDGSVRTADTDRDRDKVTLFQDFFSTASLAAGAGDSSGVQDVHAYRYIKTLWKVTPIGASVNTTVRLAVSFRECMNGNVDSTSIFPEYQYGMSPVGSITASTPNDTTVAGHLITGTVSVPWSGEYVLTFNMNRSGTGATGSPLIFSYPNGASIPLDNFFGRAARFNMLQVRVRNLNITGPAVKINLSMIGFAQ